MIQIVIRMQCSKGHEMLGMPTPGKKITYYLCQECRQRRTLDGYVLISRHSVTNKQKRKFIKTHGKTFGLEHCEPNIGFAQVQHKVENRNCFERSLLKSVRTNASLVGNRVFGFLLSDRRSLAFLAVGLALRFALAPFLGHPYDLRVFMAAGWAVGHGQTPYGEYFLQSILSNMSHPHLSGFFYGIGYPPVWGLILGLMYQLSNITSPNNIYVYAFTLKIPIIIFDVATAFLLRKLLTLKLDVQVASKVFQFYLLCPFMLLVGVVWGMFDVAVFFFSILSAYLLLNRASISAASLAIACVLKPYAVILVPLYSIFIYKTSRSFSKAFFFFVGVSSMLAVVTFIPMFWFNWSISNLYYALSSQIAPTDIYSSGKDFTYGAASPFNLFNVIRLINVEFEPASILNYGWIVACIFLYLYVAHRKFDVDFKSVINYSFLTSLVFFTTRSWVSEQNLLYLLSFFTLTILLNGAQEGWKHIHAFWILLSVFVLIHVPVSSFLWMVYPETLNAANAFCNGPLGYLRWVSMSILTVSWLILLWHNVSRRHIKL